MKDIRPFAAKLLFLVSLLGVGQRPVATPSNVGKAPSIAELDADPKLTRVDLDKPVGALEEKLFAQIKRMSKSMGLKEPPIFYVQSGRDTFFGAEYPAQADVTKDGKRIVILGDNFINGDMFQEASRTVGEAEVERWVNNILGHEIGHHALRHTDLDWGALSDTRKKQMELDAYRIATGPKGTCDPASLIRLYGRYGANKPSPGQVSTTEIIKQLSREIEHPQPGCEPHKNERSR
jgi:hypothetical protein